LCPVGDRFAAGIAMGAAVQGALYPGMVAARQNLRPEY
jgi:hypothetical protein